MYEDIFEIDFVIGVIDQEIEYARSQLQPHDTGHIHTAISWLTQRREELDKLKSALSSAG